MVTQQDTTAEGGSRLGPPRSFSNTQDYYTTLAFNSGVWCPLSSFGDTNQCHFLIGLPPSCWRGDCCFLSGVFCQKCWNHVTSIYGKKDRVSPSPICWLHFCVMSAPQGCCTGCLLFGERVSPTSQLAGIRKPPHKSRVSPALAEVWEPYFLKADKFESLCI